MVLKLIGFTGEPKEAGTITSAQITGLHAGNFDAGSCTWDNRNKLLELIVDAPQVAAGTDLQVTIDSLLQLPADGLLANQPSLQLRFVDHSGSETNAFGTFEHTPPVRGVVRDRALVCARAPRHLKRHCAFVFHLCAFVELKPLGFGLTPMGEPISVVPANALVRKLPTDTLVLKLSLGAVVPAGGKLQITLGQSDCGDGGCLPRRCLAWV